MIYVISQSRNSLHTVNISDAIKDKLLSDLSGQFYHVLAIVSKIFDENPLIDTLSILLSVRDDLIIIRGSLLNGDFASVKEAFENNGFTYETL